MLKARGKLIDPFQTLLCSFDKIILTINMTLGLVLKQLILLCTGNLGISEVPKDYIEFLIRRRHLNLFVYV